MEKEDDLTFVMPGRREEVRRRLKVIRRYIANPTKEEALRAQEELQIGHSSFHLLVRTFRRTGDPARIGGASREKTKSGGRTPEDFRHFISRVVEGAPDLSERDLIRRIQAEATLRGIALPYNPTLRRLIRANRDQRARHDLTLGAEYAVDVCVLKLPVISDAGVVGRPAAALLIDLVSRKLAGIALSAERPDSRLVARLLQAAALSTDTLVSAPSIVLSPPDDEDDLPAALADCGFDVRIRPFKLKSQGWIAALELQRTLASVKIERGKIWLPLEQRPEPVFPRDPPMTLQQAEEYLWAREAHERGVSRLPFPAKLYDKLSAVLASRQAEGDQASTS